jgi:hypothetical protein
MGRRMADNGSQICDKQAVLLADEKDISNLKDIIQTQIMPVLNIANKPFDVHRKICETY